MSKKKIYILNALDLLVLIYSLHMNNMMSPKIEITEMVVVATDLDALKKYVEDQKAPEHWRDGQWSKVFKKDSPLEWYNAPGSLDEMSPFNDGVNREWVRLHVMQEFLQQNPHVVDLSNLGALTTV